MSRQDRWATPEWEAVLARKAAGETWFSIAADYDTTANSLKVLAHRRRKGLHQGQEDVHRARRAAAVDIVMRGETRADRIAEQLGISACACDAMLRRAGISRVERDRIAAKAAARVDAASRVCEVRGVEREI